MDIDGIKLRLKTDYSGPVSELCLALVDRMAAMPVDQLQRLTIPLLANFVSLPPQDVVLQSAITALTTVRDHPLTLYFIFLDTEDDREIEVPASEVLLSVDEGVFIHPRTGDPVGNFRTLLQPAYKASVDFAQMLEGRS